MKRVIRYRDMRRPKRRGAEHWKPKVRSECPAERPCPYVSCRHHLYLDVSHHSGSIILSHPELEPWELDETCALDVADRGGLTLREVSELMGVTRERVRQLQECAMSSAYEATTSAQRELVLELLEAADAAPPNEDPRWNEVRAQGDGLLDRSDLSHLDPAPMAWEPEDGGDDVDYAR